MKTREVTFDQLVSPLRSLAEVMRRHEAEAREFPNPDPASVAVADTLAAVAGGIDAAIEQAREAWER